VQRRVTGLVNKLTDANKDGILRELMTIYGESSHQYTNAALFDNIFLNIKASVHKFPTMCLLYATLISGLHVVVGSHVTGYVLERCFESMKSSIRSSIAESDLVTKLPHNLLIFLCCLYDLRFIHHRIISDLFAYFSTSDCIMFLDSRGEADEKVISELRLDFLEVIAQMGGEYLRVDDPTTFQTSLDQVSASFNISDPEMINIRQQYVLETLSNIKSGANKFKQFNESVRASRKWIGSIKSSFPHRKVDTALNLSLDDLMNIEVAGRWWSVGASWRSNLHDDGTKTPAETTSKPSVTESIDPIDRAAAKMKLGGGNKKAIFRVLMNSRDVADAFESLIRLDLKGKGDRDIVRVLCECCCHESPYNPFYSEISKLLCESSRQAKITFQFVIWDAIKSFRYNQGKSTSKQIVNLSRLCAELVLSFTLPLIILKIFSATEIFESDKAFLMSFFLSLFTLPHEDSTVVDITDRVAASKDFASVRDLISIFLKVSDLYIILLLCCFVSGFLVFVVRFTLQICTI
jgi:nucleolar MIF4G domain-containing protein 1